MTQKNKAAASMDSKGGMARKTVAMAAGLSLMALIGAGGAQAMFAQDGDEPVVQDDQGEKKRVKITRAGDGPLVIRKGHKLVVGSTGDEQAFTFTSDRTKALDQARAALDQVVARLAKTKNKEEKAALEAAQAGLQASIEALEGEGNAFLFRGDLDFDFDWDDEDMEHALTELENHEGDLKGMRFELHRDLAEARKDIEEALADLGGNFDIEIEADGDLRAFHFKSLQDARESLDGMEEEQLAALQQAQEELQRAREKLEKRLAERRAKEAEPKPDKDQQEN